MIAMTKRYVYIILCVVFCIMLSMCSIERVYPSTASDYYTESKTKIKSLQLNEMIKLSELFPFEWDSVKIANCPMGLVDDFDWEEYYDYKGRDSYELSSHETLSVFIFYLNGNIVDVTYYNFANYDSYVIRPYKHERLEDICTYDRENAIFYYSGLGSFGEKIFIAVQQ